MALEMSGKPLLVLNAGSSSLKFALFDGSDGQFPVQRAGGQIAGIGRTATFSVTVDGEKSDLPGHGAIATHDDALAALFSWLAGTGAHPSSCAGIGHRMVHGGSEFTKPVVVTDAICDRLDALAPLAPHHMPHNVGAIRACRAHAPDLPQIACFDTAFHADQPDIEKRLPLPASFWQRGLRRYGFHGLNYEHVVHALPAAAGGDLPSRVLAFHLGNGASASAIKDGRSAGTTMGFSTLDGLIMGTRCGSIDPGVLIHLMRSDGYDADKMEDLLYNRSGLLGLSGTSSDMRDLLASDRPEAALAVDKYCLAAARAAASLIPLLGGLDGIVFTGGIGENAAVIRARITGHLDWLGARIDDRANGENGSALAADGSDVGIWIVPANEELTIARQMSVLLGSETSGS